MLTVEEATAAHTLNARGWTISAIARHLRRDRKTIRRYLTGEQSAGPRRRRTDPVEPFLAYCQQRLTDDPHLHATTLFEELTELGYQSSYSAFTAALRRHSLRPDCEICRNAHEPQAPSN